MLFHDLRDRNGGSPISFSIARVPSKHANRLCAAPQSARRGIKRSSAQFRVHHYHPHSSECNARCTACANWANFERSQCRMHTNTHTHQFEPITRAPKHNTTHCILQSTSAKTINLFILLCGECCGPFFFFFSLAHSLACRFYPIKNAFFSSVFLFAFMTIFK